MTQAPGEVTAPIMGVVNDHEDHTTMKRPHDPTSTPEDLIAFASEWAGKVFRRDGEIHPIWHAITRGGEHLILPTPWGDSYDRDLQTAMVRVLFDLKDVVRYVLLHEAWMADFRGTRLSGEQAEALREELNRDGVKNRPDRIEVVMIQAEVEGHVARSAFRRIVRPPRRRAILAPLDMFNLAGANAEGRLVGMLPVRGGMQ